MKTYIKAKDEPLFLVINVTEVQSEGIQFDPQMVFNNFYPKIYAVTSVFYSFFMIYRSYVTYPDTIQVPSFINAVTQQLLALLGLSIFSLILWALFLVPLSCSGYALGDMNKIGEGFGTIDYDELVERNEKEI
jgi:hypothetical protein